MMSFHCLDLKWPQDQANPFRTWVRFKAGVKIGPVNVPQLRPKIKHIVILHAGLLGKLRLATLESTENPRLGPCWQHRWYQDGHHIDTLAAEIHWGRSKRTTSQQSVKSLPFWEHELNVDHSSKVANEITTCTWTSLIRLCTDWDRIGFMCICWGSYMDWIPKSVWNPWLKPILISLVSPCAQDRIVFTYCRHQEL